MSTNTILKSSAIAAMTLAGLSVTASANAQSSRYANVYDYESGRNCGQACVAPAPMGQTSSRYGNTVTHSAPMHVAPGPIYVDCAQMGTCAPQPTTVYTQPAPVQYQAAPTYAAPAPTYTQAPANCPAGTTAQSDGTCMQSSYGSSTTYAAPTGSYGSSTSYSSSSSMTSSMPADCPAGTTAQSDGTCLQGSTSYSAPTLPGTYDSFSSSSTYSSSTTAPANCPAGTTAQSDGTCMQGGSVSSYTGSSVELYTGDAATTAPSYGYTSEGTYTATDYLPIRK
ncbi:hypothetical protein [Hellea balneolensis]|uniref:hypothetical protein n=1 Tax=Hellea balneolensis TaxID=287478 RepID=UPI0004179D10|nr:hypothetical protein [Hellea balneolensis]